MTTALEGGEWSAVRPGRTLPPGKDPVPFVQQAGWVPGPVWTGAENLAPTGIRSPDRPGVEEGQMKKLRCRRKKGVYVYKGLVHTSLSLLRLTWLLPKLKIPMVHFASPPLDKSRVCP
jgi:hypothetical protein